MMKKFGASVKQGGCESWDCSFWRKDSSGRSCLCVEIPEGGRKDVGNIFPVVLSNRKRDSLHKLGQGILFGQKKNPLVFLRIIQHWCRLPREVVSICGDTSCHQSQLPLIHSHLQVFGSISGDISKVSDSISLRTGDLKIPVHQEENSRLSQVTGDFGCSMEAWAP